MHVLAFTASNSSTSINQRLVDHAVDVLGGLVSSTGEELTVATIDMNDFEMPLYSQDRQAADGIPEPAHRFRETIGAADAVIASFPEHNGGLPAAYKNLYDWTSRIDMNVWQGARMVLMATSPGGRGGKGVLDHVAMVTPFFGGDVRGVVSVPSFHANFDAEAGALTDEALATELRTALEALVGD